MRNLKKDFNNLKKLCATKDENHSFIMGLRELYKHAEEKNEDAWRLFFLSRLCCEEGKPDEGITACDTLMETFGNSRDPETLELVAKALGTKAWLLCEMRDEEEGLELFDELKKRFETTHHPACSPFIAEIMVSKGLILSRLNHYNRAILAFETTEDYCEQCEGSGTDIFHAKALLGKAAALKNIGEHEESEELYTQVEEQYGNSKHPEIAMLVTKARNRQACPTESRRSVAELSI